MFDTSGNTSFSKALPGLQLAVDSTSLGEYKTCPRKYFYSIVLGYQPRLESVHLTFGLLMHGARERYDHARVSGLVHDDALDSVLAWALCETWDSELGRPWISDHKVKNRATLVRSIVWYLDKFGSDDSLETVLLSSGKPAVELSFRFDSGLKAKSTGESIVFCGHLDRLAKFSGGTYVVDLKTTLHSLDPSWFAGFTPGNQFSMYLLAGQIAFNEPVQGLIVDGLQVGVGFTRFQRGLVRRDSGSLGEWQIDAGWWVARMEESALAGHWPLNDKACDMYGGCQFRPVCSRPPSAREQWLRTDYKRRVWDPLQRRGDV